MVGILLHKFIFIFNMLFCKKKKSVLQNWTWTWVLYKYVYFEYRRE